MAPVAEGVQVVATGGQPRGSAFECWLVATRLGLTCFGGPVAHLGYFRDEYVVRRKWLDEATYADLIALAQTLPGPSSSQVGIAIGILRAGLAGGLAAWLGFTLPSAIAMVAFATVVQSIGPEAQGWLHGLQVVAVAPRAQPRRGSGAHVGASPARSGSRCEPPCTASPVHWNMDTESHNHSAPSR